MPHGSLPQIVSRTCTYCARAAAGWSVTFASEASAWSDIAQRYSHSRLPLAFSHAPPPPLQPRAPSDPPPPTPPPPTRTLHPPRPQRPAGPLRLMSRVFRACILAAAFARMVRLRDFELPVGEEEEPIPWLHVPVAPRVVFVEGARTVVVDASRAQPGVRPRHVIDPSPDAEWEDDGYASSTDGSVLRFRPSRRRTRPPSAERAASPVQRTREDGTGEPGGAPHGCERCGELGHEPAACRVFPLSDRGASHRALGVADLGAPAVATFARLAPNGACEPGSESVFAALTAALQAAAPGTAAFPRAAARAWLRSPGSASQTVHGRTLADWIKLDSERAWTVSEYRSHMGTSARGGVLEIAMCSVARDVGIDVWREGDGRLVLVAAFGAAGGLRRPVLNLQHVGGRVYAPLDMLPRRLRKC